MIAGSLRLAHAYHASVPTVANFMRVSMAWKQSNSKLLVR